MRPAFRSKSGSRGKIQLRYVQGRRASSRSQRQTVVVLIASTMSRATATRAISETERRASGSPRSAGRSQARALISTTTRGGKGPRPAASGAIAKARLTLLEVALAPAAHGLADRPESLGDLVVAETISRKDHDLGSTQLPPSAESVAAIVTLRNLRTAALRIGPARGCGACRSPRSGCCMVAY